MAVSFGWRPSPRATKALFISAFAILSLCTLWTLRYHVSSTSSAVAAPIGLHDSEGKLSDEQRERPSPSGAETVPEKVPPRQHRYAFATILTGEDDTETDIKDPYFTAARLLTYQLLHSPHTKSSTDIPFLVLVTEDVPQQQRDILSRDGAIVVPVEGFSREWIQPKWERWKSVLAKLNLWKLTEYEKVTFLDADSVIFEPIDGIFTERATMTQITRPSSAAISTPGPMPDSYMIAGMHDRWVEAALPPVPGRDFYAKDNYMNAGFFVLAPSEAMFKYYLFLLDQPGLFDPAYPEQNLLNYAHRVDGRMPWQDIGPLWSQKGSSFEHYDPRLKSLHQKWWKTSYDQTFDERIANAMAELKDYLGKHEEGTVQPRSR
ncbi:putative glycosyl transferase family 8 family [Aspergillus fischeri NRRL 181]|uniref:Glycosyl transferase family 8 family, putative n=1 Tax=Neosartorya fischeri (strain ATCC 1020 / DSM 3700 / CBS 544.65 / FGSC A1164 / JCM 1740 / NRRL 181 / WB 181) TaxID=331117 RepID=A1DKW3_NEOFI|nr:glycosyl transferase family 8 family, putative [Aspergillus fischeri NRRL 181]EAW15434.1 glycosyl transferase family 8 family, putative [Aspergillus fischeri NRRL 181]